MINKEILRGKQEATEKGLMKNTEGISDKNESWRKINERAYY